LAKSIRNFSLGDKKGDYDDLFDFDSEKVLPYFDPIERLINTIEQEIAK
jgi:hypothetical protein